MPGPAGGGIKSFFAPAAKKGGAKQAAGAPVGAGLKAFFAPGPVASIGGPSKTPSSGGAGSGGPAETPAKKPRLDLTVTPQVSPMFAAPGLAAVLPAATKTTQASSAPGTASLAVLDGLAHSAIDLAKAGSWKDLVAFLDKHPNAVNHRPTVREYAVIHQAAYLGCHEVVAVLMEEYDADPLLPTKVGLTAEQVARSRGHQRVIDVLAGLVGDDADAGFAHPAAPSPPVVSPSPPASVPAMVPAANAAVPSPGPAASPPILPIPEFTPELVAAAHGLIDKAKSGKWAAVFKLLSATPLLVNVRPVVREMACLHQAAYFGDAVICARLVEEFGADPALLTKSGKYPEEVASDQENHSVAASLAAHRKSARIAAKEPVCGSSAGEEFDMVQQADGSWKVVQTGGA